ncbi:LpxI family protein [Limisalsivibrio acetivorans]|uniref:LpxI family protein n=1 Tax=Limisalsivibrio acetivorans TaxID=1304888 RepID=UPI0003B41A7A|nr:UDP-2,3-diacylglucosamine diphosphatase LpxI [Limisalsivibrio acetivorans]
MIGVVAGNGDMPRLVAESVRESGKSPVCIALSSSIAESLAGCCDDVTEIPPVQVGKIIKTLVGKGVRDVVFAGKVEKSILFEKIRFDSTAIKMLLTLPDRRDDTIMNGIRREFEKKGLRILKQTEVLKNYLVPEGTLTKRQPTKDEMKDIAFGFTMAKKIGELDIGQTIVVRNRAVVAVEAIEGTDRAVQRGCSLAGEGGVVVKVKRPGQDERFDIPTVGVDTLRHIADNNGAVLAIEAEKTFVVNLEECIRFADGAGIAFVSYRD